MLAVERLIKLPASSRSPTNCCRRKLPISSSASLAACRRATQRVGRRLGACISTLRRTGRGAGVEIENGRTCNRTAPSRMVESLVIICLLRLQLKSPRHISCWSNWTTCAGFAIEPVSLKHWDGISRSRLGQREGIWQGHGRTLVPGFSQVARRRASTFVLAGSAEY